jgi:hypothetical protein
LPCFSFSKFINYFLMILNYFSFIFLLFKNWFQYLSLISILGTNCLVNWWKYYLFTYYYYCYYNYNYYHSLEFIHEYIFLYDLDKNYCHLNYYCYLINSQINYYLEDLLKHCESNYQYFFTNFIFLLSFNFSISL